MRECPTCKKEMAYICSLINTHLTGDEKRFRVLKCDDCSVHHLYVYMEASLSSGDNYFEFRIQLTGQEAKDIIKVISECADPYDMDGKCPAHNYLDKFDYENIKRRVIIEDYFERWT